MRSLMYVDRIFSELNVNKALLSEANLKRCALRDALVGAAAGHSLPQPVTAYLNFVTLSVATYTGTVLIFEHCKNLFD
jgi:hypothetical protein